MQIVLIEPEIPQNTGSIARLCAANQLELHLVGKLGFELSEKTVRRAGLDYWPYVNLTQHNSWQEYLDTAKPNRFWLFSSASKKAYFEIEFKQNDALVFGKESCGLDRQLLNAHPENCLTIPMINKNVRSLNISNAVSVASYEALRQMHQRGLPVF